MVTITCSVPGYEFNPTVKTSGEYIYSGIYSTVRQQKNCQQCVFRHP